MSDARQGEPFSRLRVLDASDSVAGQFAARILADYGAKVFLVEDTSGTSVRRIGPFDPRGNPPENSLLFHHLNTRKHPCRIDRGQVDHRARLIGIAAGADVVVTDDRVLAAALSSANPCLVIGVVSDFAATGPYAGWQGSEMIHQALGGLMYMTGREGEEPLFGFGHRASYSAGSALAAAIIAGLLDRDVSGTGQVVSVDLHETAASMCQHLVTQYSYNRTFPGRGVYPTGGVDIFRCSDGWVVLYCRSDRWQEFCREFGADDLAEDPEFSPSLFVKNWTVAHRRVSPHLSNLPVAEVVARTHKVRVIAAKVMTPADVLACPHLAARNYWDKEIVDGSEALLLGPLFRLDPLHRRSISPPPRLDSERAVPKPAVGPQEAVTQPTARKAPLSGVRVVEMTTAWAGPMLGRILAHLGAEVIKIESTAVTDSFRGNPKGGSRTQYPDGEPGPRPFNRAVPYNAQNLGKLSLNLDLKADSSRPIMRRLIGTVDAVICNFSPRAMRGLGLDYDSLRAFREDIIVLELPAAGSGGPLADIAGVGHTMEALAGVTSLQGYADGEPQRTGSAYLDPIGAFNGAIAVCLALYDRRRNGSGRRIELAQREAAMQWLGESLLLCARGGQVPAPDGNRIPAAAPHGAFRTAGDDAWIAIGVFSDAEWIQLCAELDDAELASDPRFASHADRRKHDGALRVLVERRTRGRRKTELAAALQARGVRAAPVCSGEDLHDDPQLIASGFLLDIAHPEAGVHRHHGLPFRFSASPTNPPKHAPLLGEHTDQVLHGLGFDDEIIRELKEQGVIAQAELPELNTETA